MSGTSKNPTKNPTNGLQKPDKLPLDANGGESRTRLAKSCFDNDGREIVQHRHNIACDGNRANIEVANSAQEFAFRIHQRNTVIALITALLRVTVYTSIQ